MALRSSLVLDIRASSAYFSPEFIDRLSGWAESIRLILAFAFEPSDIDGRKLVEAEMKYQHFSSTRAATSGCKIKRPLRTRGATATNCKAEREPDRPLPIPFLAVTGSSALRWRA